MHLGFRYCTLFVLLLVVVAVSRAEDPATSSFYPLAVGTTWEYKAGENRFQLRVARIEEVGKTKCARVELIINGKTVSHEHIGLTKTGLARFSFEGKEAIPPIEFLRLPAKTGDTWKVDSKVDNQPVIGTFKVGSEQVKVPAGTFSAVSVASDNLEANGVKLKVTNYFSEKTGMVKQVVELGGQQIVIELEKFEPAKGK